MKRDRDVTPALVRSLAEVEVRVKLPFAFGQPASTPTHQLVKPFGWRESAQRLLKVNEEMQNVWRTLQRKKPKPYALEQWQALNRPLRIPDEGASLQDKACAVFFNRAASLLDGSRIKALLHYDRSHWGIWSEEEVDKSAEPLRSAAKHCWDAMRNDHRAATDEELAIAISIVGEYFEEKARQHIQSFAPSHIIVKKGRLGRGRSSPMIGRRPGDDDIICAQVRALAVETDKLFGRFMCPTLATVATVALGETIHDQQVAKWCKRKPALQNCP